MSGSSSYISDFSKPSIYHPSLDSRSKGHPIQT